MKYLAEDIQNILELEALEERYGHLAPLTKEELKKVIPIELSAKERRELVADRERALCELDAKYNQK
jgi:hypothetical protein